MYLHSLLEEVERRNFKIIVDEKLIETRNSLLKICSSFKNGFLKKFSSEQLSFLWSVYDQNVFFGDNEKAMAIQEFLIPLLQASNNDNEKIKNLFNTYDELLKKCSITDNLEQYLKEQKEDTFYYIGINEFVFNYYKDNPKSEWKIKAILQYGFHFEFGEAKKYTDSSF